MNNAHFRLCQWLLLASAVFGLGQSAEVFFGALVSGMGPGGLYAMGLEGIAGAEDMGVGLGGPGAMNPEESSESESTEDFPPQFCPPSTTPQQFCLPTMGMGGFGMLGQQMPLYALQPQVIAPSMQKFSGAVVSKMGPRAMSGMGPGKMALGQGGMSEGESTEEFPPQLCPPFTTPQQFCMPQPNTMGMGGFGMPASMNGQQMLYAPQPPIVSSMPLGIYQPPFILIPIEQYLPSREIAFLRNWQDYDESVSSEDTTQPAPEPVNQSAGSDNGTMRIIVKVKQGALEGVAGKLLDGSTFYKFRGIPYAQPPVGKLRFKDPLPPQPWTGIYDAKKNGKKCPQLDLSEHMILDGHEDCLFLNVFTKSLEPKALLPVMVFIHGGAFYTGSCNDNAYGPRYLVRHNVILVTMNYRLEALGFMCLDTPEVPGNAGIKDQVAALRWVKENIAQFGGDPNNVLLFGESAGSASVTFHLLSPMTRGLFQKAIAQSGSCLDKWLTGYDLRDRAFRLGKHLGKDTDDGEELLQFLQSVKALDLVNVTNPVLTLDELYRYPPLAWAPTVEKRFENVEPFLTELPIDVLLANKINKVPFMIGYTSKEGYLFLKYRLKKIEVYNKNVTYLLPADIIHNLSADNATEFGERVKRFYVGNGTFSNETSEEVTDDLTDSYFSANIHRFTDFYKNRLGSTIPIYMYKFSYDTQLNIFKAELGLANEKGAAHADDVAYLFESSENIEIYKAQDKAKKRVNMMTQLWTNFAKSGNPTPDNYFGVEWPQYTSQEKAYLNIDISMTKGIYADQERIRFWNNLYCEANLPCMSNDTYNDFKTSDYI